MWRRYLNEGWLVYWLVTLNVALAAVVVRIAWPYRALLAELVVRWASRWG